MCRSYFSCHLFFLICHPVSSKSKKLVNTVFCKLCSTYQTTERKKIEPEPLIQGTSKKAVLKALTTVLVKEQDDDKKRIAIAPTDLFWLDAASYTKCC